MTILTLLCAGGHTGARPGLACRLCWLRANREEYAARFGIYTPPDGTVQVAVPIATIRVAQCRFIGKRLEEKAGCNSGWRCRHVCGSSDQKAVSHLSGIMEAVPAVDCQECPVYEILAS